MKWCSRRLVSCPFRYGLCTSKTEFEKALKKMKVEGKVKFLGTNNEAVTHFFVTKKKQTRIIVTIKKRNRSKAKLFSILAHEGMHIWQEIKRQFEERKPSQEFEAYSLQHIIHELFKAYKRNG